MAETPTIFGWGGGTEAFGRWLNPFYDLVEEEGTLAPIFGGTVSREHRDHVLLWWCEVMGGPAEYTATLGGYPRCSPTIPGSRSPRSSAASSSPF